MSDKNNQVEKFDPAKLMEGVKDRIKATFVSLIPDDKWDEMVQKEINDFFNATSKLAIAERYKTGSYWEKYLVVEADQSPFRALVWAECMNKAASIVKEKITTEYLTKISDTEFDTNDEMKKLIEDALPKATQQFFANMADQMLIGMEGRINSTLINMQQQFNSH